MDHFHVLEVLIIYDIVIENNDADAIVSFYSTKR